MFESDWKSYKIVSPKYESSKNYRIKLPQKNQGRGYLAHPVVSDSASSFKFIEQHLMTITCILLYPQFAKTNHSVVLSKKLNIKHANAWKSSVVGDCHGVNVCFHSHLTMHNIVAPFSFSSSPSKRSFIPYKYS